MSPAEWRASGTLAAVFALRMLGLFLMSPVFAIYATTLNGGDNPILVGIALGMFSLVQAFFQIPLGIASDKFGRKPVIVAGLLLFAIGAVVCACSGSLNGILIGRAIQGVGAISAAITALIADATREQHRTKAMAMVGGSIGISFALAMVISPLLYTAIGMPGMFEMTAVLALAAIAVVLWVTPDAPAIHATPVPLSSILRHRELMRLNFGVYVLHLAQMAMFVVLPGTLVKVAGLPIDQHWKVYLPVMLGSFVAMLPAIIIGEKYNKMKPVFLFAISLLLIVQVGFWQLLAYPLAIYGLLFAFFIAFNILEAAQPSLVSRTAPPASKGAALGVYNTLQALGMASGGALGGILTRYATAPAIFALCAGMTVLWLVSACSMPELARRAAAAPLA
ncbi:MULTISPECIES: MFS transporter [unclassified Undibacterium]|uniref:MFS transporter n=2 Tax=Undibacterium TaxID=401469 RepID=UPI002AC91D61|nr:MULTISPECIES: MFS transporter [unclassified Undibacterium]MEB0140425.1 MFS transporter [Undibacterium sp. CCC2.1]MEB0173928.1 MFS transporter [Undibacterium sp. CCC1.1]MEB0177406.1 MFS transporter [Undibacterium sp. CCC3.4]MEB0217105.1 MFS transporter [Undibacterium sp. 5I2]WPX45617.1 MFS transporter [Undibacterium sp. CCC3.4]